MPDTTMNQTRQPNPPAPTIRRATTADAVAIAALVETHVADGDLLPVTATRVAEQDADFIVATDDGGRVVGCAHLREYSPSLAEIRSLAVDADHAGSGLEGALLTAIEQLAVARDYPTLFTVTNDVDFFRARGYAPWPVPELHPERDEVGRFAGVLARELGED